MERRVISGGMNCTYSSSSKKKKKRRIFLKTIPEPFDVWGVR